MVIRADQLQRALEIFLHHAYAGVTVPAAVLQRVDAVRALGHEDAVSEDLLEPFETGACTPGTAIERAYALRIGQPMYPHMKLVIESEPAGNGTDAGEKLLFRADAHDRHLHAPAGSPDAAWLASVRSSNKKLTESIEAAWSQAGIPTFKDYLRKQLENRRKI